MYLILLSMQFGIYSDTRKPTRDSSACMKVSSEEIYGKSNQGNAEKYIQCDTTMSLTIRVYLHSFSCCCLQNLRIPAKFSPKFKLIAVQGHPRSQILVSIESAYAIPISH